MKQVSSLKNLYRKSMFDDSLIGFILNPSFIVRSSIYKILAEKASLFENLDVLDVGCGSKPYKDLFKGSRKYIGIDTNHSGHDHRDEEIDILYDGFKMPIADDAFDAVVSFQVLEHVVDVDLYLSEIRRVVKKDGIIVMSIPFTWPEHEQPYDFRRLSSFGIIEKFKHHDFEILELIKTTNYLQTVVQLSCSYLALTLKSKSAILNLLMISIFTPWLNLLGKIFKYSKNYDLFCDVVVIARKNKHA